MSTFPFKVGQILRSSQLNATFDAPVANVIGYGAIGNGVADDATAIRAAIASLPASGGVVFLPTGTYRITGAWIIIPSNVLIQGAGPNSSIIKPDNMLSPDGSRTIFANPNRAGYNPISTSPPTSPATQTDMNIGVSDLGFDMSNIGSTGCALGSFLLAKNLSWMNIRADNHLDVSQHGYAGPQFIGCDNYIVDNYSARNCGNGIDNWKGNTRAKFSNITLETNATLTNGGAINWQAIGTTKADFGNSIDLQIVNATIWLNSTSLTSGIALYLDANGGGSESTNILLDNIVITAQSGTTTNTGIVFRGWGSRLKARGISFSAVSGADMVPINMGGFFSPTAPAIAVGLITTFSGSASITCSYPGGCNIGPGNFFRINDGSGGPVIGNGLTLSGYYPITAVSGPVTPTTSGNSFTVTAPMVATSSGVISVTTELLGYRGCVASCDLSSITIDGCFAQGGDLISLAGSGHQATDIVVTTNYNGFTTPQYRSIVAVDATQAHELSLIVSTSVNGIAGTAGTVALQGGWSGDNILTWLGQSPGFSYPGTSSVDHMLSTTDATIGTLLRNQVFIEGRATGFPPRIHAKGKDTDVSLGLHPQGAGNVQVQDGTGAVRHIFSTSAQLSIGSNGNPAFVATAAASQVNWITATAAATGVSPSVGAADSSDTNVSVEYKGKGTGGFLGRALTITGPPGTSDIPNHDFALALDGSGHIRLYCNNGGTIISSGTLS